ncbi:Hypp6436 [Branchiostoma lanceolatum]|uniref:Hypp6436 protein n=1 Tax=Branchiostoma lanceolatum TaxID=7740 RepID=A0A8K0E474_BRALA|nr:Hypp6436 [Branchiostoma lanceolatum]
MSQPHIDDHLERRWSSGRRAGVTVQLMTSSKMATGGQDFGPATQQRRKGSQSRVYGLGPALPSLTVTARSGFQKKEGGKEYRKKRGRENDTK